MPHATAHHLLEADIHYAVREGKKASGSHEHYGDAQLKFIPDLVHPLSSDVLDNAPPVFHHPVSFPNFPKLRSHLHNIHPPRSNFDRPEHVHTDIFHKNQIRDDCCATVLHASVCGGFCWKEQCKSESCLTRNILTSDSTFSIRIGIPNDDLC